MTAPSTPPPAAATPLEGVRTDPRGPLCLACGRPLTGRRDARTCSASCRASHHRAARRRELLAALDDFECAARRLRAALTKEEEGPSGG